MCVTAAMISQRSAYQYHLLGTGRKSSSPPGIRLFAPTWAVLQPTPSKCSAWEKMMHVTSSGIMWLWNPLSQCTDGGHCKKDCCRVSRLPQCLMHYWLIYVKPDRGLSLDSRVWHANDQAPTARWYQRDEWCRLSVYDILWKWIGDPLLCSTPSLFAPSKWAYYSFYRLNAPKCTQDLVDHS